jgi:hypothetical protein
MKQNPRELHLQHYIFGSETPVSVIYRYAKTKNGWEFSAYKCHACETTLKFTNSVLKHISNCREINTIKKEKEMPIQVLMVKGERMYRYGDSGKAYKTREEAEKQMRAMYASGYKEKKLTEKK